MEIFTLKNCSCMYYSVVYTCEIVHFSDSYRSQGATNTIIGDTYFWPENPNLRCP